jgi:hypothetical protein
MFFADGDFHSYKINPLVRGNVARISYILARQGGVRAQAQNRTKRILARTQHILTADPALAGFLDPNNFSDAQWYQWNNQYEYDKMSLDAWKIIPWQNKADILSVITDVEVNPSIVGEQIRGAMVEAADPNSIHMLLCEGVGEFKIQGWSDAQQRWVPEVDPDGNGDLTDTHFFPVDSNNVPGVLYPYPPYGGVTINNIEYPVQQVNEANFYAIPGLGRALKFTFTLYDSKGIIKEGRTFTHIVYLDN